MATAKQMDEITECPICTEVYADPRVLPCGHTYCLKCLEKLSEDKQPGVDEVACPLCRKVFIVPDNGVKGVPKNFFVANFLQMKELSSVKSKTSLCEACDGEESESEAQNVVSVSCFECQMKLCRSCKRAHRGVKLTRSHKLVEIGKKLSEEALVQSLPPTYCDRHKNEMLKLYCFD